MSADFGKPPGDPRRVYEYEFPFEDDEPDWNWCIDAATFSHREACEFLIWIPDDRAVVADKIVEMKQAGCSSLLINLFKQAFHAKVEFLLLWA